MDEIVKLHKKINNLEKKLIIDEYNSFLEEYSIDHKTLNSDVTCSSLNYNSNRCDAFSVVCSEYFFSIELFSAKTNETIYICVDSQHTDNSSAKSTEVKINKKSVYYKAEMFGDASEYLEMSDVEDDVKIINKVKNDKSMTLFVKKFIPSAKIIIDQLMSYQNK